MDIRDKGSFPSATRRLISSQTRGEYFFLELAEHRRGPLVVAFGGRERCGPDYRIDRASYPFPTIEFVAEGEGEVRLGDAETVALAPGTMYGYGPGDAVQMRGRRAGMLKYFLALTGGGAAEALCEPVDLRLKVRRFEQHGEIRALLDLMVAEGRELAPRTADICLQVFRLLQLKLEQAQSRHEAAPDHARDRFEHCKAMIEEDPRRFRSVEEVAVAAGIGRHRLFRLFRRFQGVSPYQFMLRQKMNHAAHDLLSTNLLTKEIAERVGFADPLHFSRVFRQIHNTSPSQFRRSHRQ